MLNRDADALFVRSRHWFFGGKLNIDGKDIPETLMQIVKSTLKANPNNSVIGFKDNSSAIRCASSATVHAIQELQLLLL